MRVLAKALNTGSFATCTSYAMIRPSPFNPVPQASRTSIHAEIDDDLLTAFSVERKRLPVSLVRQYMIKTRPLFSSPVPID